MVGARGSGRERRWVAVAASAFVLVIGVPPARAADAGTSSDNHPPVADDQWIVARSDKVTSITLTGSDPDGDPITFEIGKWPHHGTLGGTAPNLTYTPDADARQDSFAFA